MNQSLFNCSSTNDVSFNKNIQNSLKQSVINIGKHNDIVDTD